jgi:predicted HD phosphohydrolase
MKLKSFLITLFLRQNRYHKYNVLCHTLAVTTNAIKYNSYDMILAALLHDIGKPLVAMQDEEDIKEGLGNYSFTGHEERSYDVIKNWFWVSERTKVLVRLHYLITGMAVDIRKFNKTKDTKYIDSYVKRKLIWDSLSPRIQSELMLFKFFDDNGKGYPNLVKAVPKHLEERYNQLIQAN